MLTIRRILPVAAVVAAVLVAGCGGSTSSDAPPMPTVSLVPGCSITTPPPPTSKTYDAPPPMTFDPAKTYTATMDTSCGAITIALDAKEAPATVNNFVFLAREHFFDGTRFHRIIPGYMAQGGDPTGSGSGGPGYDFADELPSGPYRLYDVAMANAGPHTNTNGSQFFIITGPQGLALQPNYSRLGHVTSGFDVVKRLDELGDPNADNGVPPRQPVYILSVSITEK